MTRDPKTVSPEVLASKALGIMDGRITTLFAVDTDGKPVGILHVHDCLRAGVA
jgi:arabinose-5-phosphate isomerase